VKSWKKLLVLVRSSQLIKVKEAGSIFLTYENERNNQGMLPNDKASGAPGMPSKQLSSFLFHLNPALQKEAKTNFKHYNSMLQTIDLHMKFTFSVNWGQQLFCLLLPPCGIGDFTQFAVLSGA